MANIKIKDIEDITLSDLFTVGKGTTHYDFYNVSIFVNFNYRLRPFIRVNAFSSKGTESITTLRMGCARLKRSLVLGCAWRSRSFID